MIITKIERQKRNASRRSIFLDGKYLFSISEELFVKHVLYEGKELTQGEIDSIIAEEAEQSVKKAALRFRSIRPRSEHEIRSYLRKKGFDDSMIEKAMDFLHRNTLLNDLEFAKMFSRDRLALKPVGKSVLKQLLYKKGIKKDIIESVTNELFSKETEKELAIKEAEKKYTRVSSLPPLTAKKRIFDHLVRRGYDSSLSLTIANTLVKQ